MITKRNFARITAFFLALITVFASPIILSFAAEEVISEVKNEELELSVADVVVDAARAKIGFYESTVNEFTSWYYGIDTPASWCSIFVSWCADQAGAIGSAVPKRATCLSMKKWFEKRGEYYPANSEYVPQKGDIVFLNTAVDGTDAIHHVEIVTQSGFITKKNTVNVKCIGGNTSDLNYNGSEYVTEKVRPVDGPMATIVGYAHPSYEKSEGVMGDIYSFADDSCPSFIKYTNAKFLEIIFRIEYFFENLFKKPVLM